MKRLAEVRIEEVRQRIDRIADKRADQMDEFGIDLEREGPRCRDCQDSGFQLVTIAHPVCREMPIAMYCECVIGRKMRVQS